MVALVGRSGEGGWLVDWLVGGSVGWVGGWVGGGCTNYLIMHGRSRKEGGLLADWVVVVRLVGWVGGWGREG